MFVWLRACVCACGAGVRAQKEKKETETRARRGLLTSLLCSLHPSASLPCLFLLFCIVLYLSSPSLCTVNSHLTTTRCCSGALASPVFPTSTHCNPPSLVFLCCFFSPFGVHSLGSNKIGAEGAAAMAEALKSNGALRRLK